MVLRALIAWLILLLLAMLNGTLREALLVPSMNESVARAISTVTLSILIFSATWILLPWIRPPSPGAAWTIGCIWLALTLAFEFLAGHYLFGESWDRLLAQYNVLGGQIWILVLIATLVSPPIVLALRDNVPLNREQR